ncbi:nuclear pore complex protein Nup153-like [Hydractinia symbiolongicarpus]|uniref:nuclear pore complex protein Nup153-like n=1 Tax=Hydractinia symbiolongicarpus TaxID=13093 RepID=UPI0025508444|nr:nuclear pore complex protein Nup153-like [Hydractinia symbiolongicarpus]
MDNQEFSSGHHNDAPRKIRTRSSRSSRSNPYKRPTSTSNQNTESDQSLIGKVTSYIVPSWISGWLTGSKTNVDVVVSDDSDVEGDDDVIHNEAAKTISQPDVITSHATKQDHFSVINEESESKETPPVLQPGFYQRYRSPENTTNLIRPSFVNDTKDERTESNPYVVPQQKLFHLDESTTKAETDATQSLATSLLYHSRKRHSVNKPAFRVSAFVSPREQSTTTFNTSLNSSSFDFSSNNRSTFYSGHTMFGGSSTMRENPTKRRKMSPVSSKVQTIRTQISAKPLRAGKRRSVTSETAKKILTTLNKMSSPLRDSRKLPPLLEKQSVSFTKQLRSSGKDKVSPYAPPVKDMNTPLKDINLAHTNVNKPIITADRKSYEIKQHVPSLSFVPQALPALFSSNTKSTSSIEKQPNANNNQDILKTSMKMKRERSVHYSSGQKDNEVVNTLPEVSLAVPLIVNSLPNFKFSATASSTIQTLTPIPKASVSVFKSKTDVTPSVGFNFALPGVISDKAVLKTPNKQFNFSSPAALHSGNSKNSSNNAKVDLPPEQNSVGSVLKPMTGDDSQDNLSKKSGSTKHIKKVQMKTLASKFLKPEGCWECPTCMIQNKSTDNVCVACSDKKPVEKESVTETFKPSNDNFKTFSTFKFAQPDSGSWECPTCMIKNKVDLLKCAACSESKPGSNLVKQEIKNVGPFNALTSTDKTEKTVFPIRQLKLKQDSSEFWECQTCMIKNKKDCSECVACGEKNPNSNATSQKVTFSDNTNKSTFSFGLSSDQANNKSLFSFGQPKDAISSKSTFSFGNSATDSATTKSTFSFGQPTSDSATSKSTFSFGQPTLDSATSKSTFSFGQPTSDSATSKSTFSFGQPTSDSATKKSTFPFGRPETDSATSKSSFSFDQPTSDSATSKSTFSFGKTTAESASNKSTSIEKVSNPSGSKTAFLFGETSDSNTGKEIVDSSVAKKPSFSFGQSSNLHSSGFSFGKPIMADAENSIKVSAEPLTDKKESTVESDSVSKDKPLFKSIKEAAKGGFLAVSSAGDDEVQTLGQQSQSFNATLFGVAKPATAATGGFKLESSNSKMSPLKSFATKTESQTNFSFGLAAPATNSAIFDLTKPSISTSSSNLFGSKAADVTAQGGFTFGIGSAKVDKNLTEKPLNFGSASNTSASFAFGTSTFKSTAPSLKTTTIETPTNVIPPVSNSGFNLGSNNSSTGFNFGGNTTMEATSNVFSATSSINYGSMNNATFQENQPPTANSGFQFQSNAPSTDAGFSFGNNGVSKPAFGSSEASAQSGIFGFGTSTVNPFNAGDATIAKKSIFESAKVSPGFDFSSSNKAAPSFNFTNGTVSTFNSTDQSTQNMFAPSPANTGNMFNMGSSSNSTGAIKSRRMKRAVRRIKK